MSLDVTISVIKDLTWYTTYLVKKGESVGKIHIPKFENGDVLVRLYDGSILISKIADCPPWFKGTYQDILSKHKEG